MTAPHKEKLILVEGSERIRAVSDVHPANGSVVWDPKKSFWMGTMTVVALIGGPLFFSLNAFLVFIALSTLTLCAGHSVGMHRRLIHNSFECPKWLEYLLVYLGVLVGMSGPIGMIRQHDLRDWAQRQTDCHDYLCHRRNIFIDYYWQCYCDVKLKRPPLFVLENRIKGDRFYDFLEKTWMLQQLPLGIVLFLVGGWGFVVWGVAVRVAVSVTGHWLVGYYAHHEFRERTENMSWWVLGACVQGRDVPIAGLISMGESWHNNHHAYPGSAKIGFLPGQPDPGWWLIMAFEKLGLASSVRTPHVMPERKGLVCIRRDGTGWSVCKIRKRIWKRVFRPG